MYTIFETFVGAGGSHIGFKSVGFTSKYVNDLDENCLKTLLYNNPDIEKTAVVDNTNIVEVNGFDILKKTKMNASDLDLFVGGIVCKGFSLAGERSPCDNRNYFYKKQLELVNIFKPKISVIENVPGMITAKVLSNNAPKEIKDQIALLWQKLENYKGNKASLRKTEKITPEVHAEGKSLREQKDSLLKMIKEKGYMVSVLSDILDTYKEYGYNVSYKVLNSAFYGSATRRERIIIVATRNDLKGEFSFPEPTHINDYLLNKYPDFYSKDKKYINAITINQAMQSINYEDKKDIDNLPMIHNEKTIERFKYIPEGKSIADLIDTLPDRLKISKFYSRGNTMRLDGNKLSPTLVPGHSNFPIHPKAHRSITVREAACITGFPLNYKFFGNHTKRCEHVGNAIPPNLAAAIGKEVKKFLDLNKNTLNKPSH